MKDALNAQKTAQVFFELDQVAPKLGELAEYLKHAHMTKLDLPCAAGFVKHLGTLMTELKRMMNDVEDVTSSIDPRKAESHTIPSAHLPQPTLLPMVTNEHIDRSWDHHQRRAARRDINLMYH
ncbi:hypothetical protein BU17DRAFT_62172 [Hysterangium stoloniferum]|nr:hypothetical protein BU17DRAFT_62172 [Hysterangium stoloniferum]